MCNFAPGGARNPYTIGSNILISALAPNGRITASSVAGNPYVGQVINNDGTTRPFNTGTAVGKAGGLVSNGTGSGSGGIGGGLGGTGLLQTVGGAVVNVGSGLNAGSTSGVVSAGGVTAGGLGNTIASINTVLGGSGTPITASTSPLASVGAAVDGGGGIFAGAERAEQHWLHGRAPYGQGAGREALPSAL